MNAFPIGNQAGGAESCMTATVELCSSGGAGASVAVLGCVLSRLGQPVAALEVAQLVPSRRTATARETFELARSHEL